MEINDHDAFRIIKLSTNFTLFKSKCSNLLLACNVRRQLSIVDWTAVSLKLMTRNKLSCEGAN